jgi:hypothetical protein
MSFASDRNSSWLDPDVVNDCPDCSDDCGCPDVTLFIESQGAVSGLVNNVPGQQQHIPGQKNFTEPISIDPSPQFDYQAYGEVSVTMTAQDLDGDPNQSGSFYSLASDEFVGTGALIGEVGISAVFTIGSDTTQQTQSVAILLPPVLDQVLQKPLFSIQSINAIEGSSQVYNASFAIDRNQIGQYCSLADGTVVKGGIIVSSPVLSTFFTGTL